MAHRQLAAGQTPGIVHDHLDLTRHPAPDPGHDHLLEKPGLEHAIQTFDASQLDGASVTVGVKVTEGVLTDVEVRGSDLIDAVRTAGGEVPPEAEATLTELRIALSYKPGPDDAPQVTAPPDDLIMTNADVKAQKGC